MKANKNWKSLTVVGVVGTVLLFSAGYFLGYAIHNQSTPTLESELVDSSETSQPIPVSSRPSVGNSEPVKGVSALEDLVLFKSHFERTIALNELLKSGTLESLQAYVEQSKNINSIYLPNTVQQAIFQRLASRYPKMALGQLEGMPIETQQPLIRSIFQEWSLANLEQTIEQAKQLAGTNRLSALDGILMSTEHLSQKERRAIARELGNEWRALEEIELENGLELFEDPEREWMEFLSSNNNNLDSLDEAQYKMLVFIATAWIVRDGIEVFEKIRESLPKQYSIIDPISSVVNKLFPHNPQLALELASNVEGMGYWSRGAVARRLLTQWVENDPQETLEAVNRVKGQYLRRQLQIHVLETWAAQDAQAFLGLIKNLPTDLQGVAQEKALIAMAKTTPMYAVELLSEIPDRQSFQNVAEVIAMQWTHHDVVGVLNWIEGDERLAAIRERLIEKVIVELSKTDPQLAMQTALTYPVDSDEEGMEAEVIQHLAIGGEFDEALSLLPQTRKGATRARAYTEIIGALFLDKEDPQRVKDAVDLFIGAVTVDSVEDFDFMLLRVSLNAPLILFDSLDDLPTEELKREVGSSLFTFNKDKGVFTEDQLAMLRELDETKRSIEMDRLIQGLSQ